jgi:methyl-accepting chemotaxis protein
MASGKNLTVYLTSDVGKFRKGLQTAEKDARGFGSRMGRIGKTIAAGLAGATVAVGALAVKLGVDAVQGALEEEKALRQLHNTVKNLGFEDATDALDDFIDSTARSTTATDDDLRPAMAKLLTATRDVTTAQRYMAIALDLSAFASVPLETAVNAVSKAAAGQVTALKKLVPGLETMKATTPDVTAVFAELGRVVDGSAAAAFGSLSGQMGQVAEDAGELQDAFGKGFLEAVTQGDASVGEMSTTLQELQPTLEEVGRTVGETVTAVSDIAGAISTARESFDGFKEDLGPFVAVLDAATTAIYNMATPILGIAEAVRVIQGRAEVGSTVTHTDPLTHLQQNPVIPDPNRSRSNSQVIVGRSNARAAQKDARTGNRP